MEKYAQAILRVQWGPGDSEDIRLRYNPKEIQLDKSVQLAEVPIPGIDAPLQQFVRGQAERLSLELFFDTSEDGTGPKAVSVTTLTDRVYELVKIHPESHAPPSCTLVWNDKFPGSDLSKRMASQRRNSFPCLVESVKQKFTHFNADGVPLRATLQVSFREHRPLHRQLKELKLSSPDRTHTHVLERGQTLAAVAGRYYRDVTQWRAIADEPANAIDDPRRIDAGAVVRVPRIDEGGAP